MPKRKISRPLRIKLDDAILTAAEDIRRLHGDAAAEEFLAPHRHEAARRADQRRRRRREKVLERRRKRHGLGQSDQLEDDFHDVGDDGAAARAREVEKHQKTIDFYARHTKSRHLKSRLKKGDFTTADPELNAIYRRRLKENRKLENAKLDKHKISKGIQDRLIACTGRHPSNLPFSPVCRLRQEEADIALALENFGGLTREQVRSETIILAVIPLMTVPGALKRMWEAIKHFRKRLINAARVHGWGTGSRSLRSAYRRVEFEILDGRTLAAAFGKVSKAEMDKVDDHFDEDEEDDAELSKTERKAKKRRQSIRKMKTLAAMGWDPSWTFDAIILHIHGLIAIEREKTYTRQITRLFPAYRQHHMKRLYKTKPMAVNTANLVRYGLKARSTSGRLDIGKWPKPFLKGKALRFFLRANAKLKLQGTKVHFNLRRAKKAQ